MKTLDIPVEEFLRPFFDPAETVCLRVFDDRKSGTFRGQKLECEAGKIAALIDSLKRHNEQNRGIFFTINYGGNTDEEITRVNAQFVECDSLSIDEQFAKVESFPLPPSLIVKTRKSLHAYWLMKDARLEKFRHIQKQLVAQFDGDPACINESRVFRLPGFYHCKEEPILVDCIKFNPELRYTQYELAAVLPEIPNDEVSNQNASSGQSVVKGTRKGLTLVGKRCLFIQHCKNNAKTLSEHDWYSMITNLAVFDGGSSAIHTLSKAYPKYKHDETEEKISHFIESGTKPITCVTIAEKGFKCPKLEDNSCGCKAPAALCYKPLAVEELREFMNRCEIKDTTIDNIQTAKEFVTEYLYNIDPVIGETFINYEIKAYFRFKTGDLKPLLALHKEVYKKYSGSKETRRETQGVGLPDWYELTERGSLRFLPGLLADYMSKNVNAFYGAGSYFFYENGVYNSQEDLAAQAKAREFLIPRHATMSAITDSVGQWRMQIRKAVREINCNPFIVNVKNGLFNVLDDSFKSHTPEYYSTVQINATYDPNAKCPQFLAFLDGILHEEEANLLQEIFGYLLIPINKAQKSFVFVGAPNAGKSTLLSIAQEVLLGSENVSNIPWQSLGDRFNKAELFGKLANIFADLPSKAIDDGGMFKSLTGEDYVTAERKSKDPFSFRPYARLLFSCNEIPKNYSDRSDGFYRRLVIIRFNRSVPSDERDPNLREKLTVERDGIFMWALEGLKRLISNKYQFSETERTKFELQRYRVESNSVLMFLEECCEIKEGTSCARMDLFERYREYCIKNGLKPLSQTNFNKEVELSDSKITRARDRIGSRHVWRGLYILD